MPTRTATSRRRGWPNSFMYNMKVNFYAKLDADLRPPEAQIQGPTDANFKDYGR